MRYLIAALASLVTLGVINPARAREFAVTIDGVRKASGMLRVAVMSEAAWEGNDQPVAVRRVAVQKSIDGKGRGPVNIATLPEA
jgi:uncharacterized protein (DUF2141 family)